MIQTCMKWKEVPLDCVDCPKSLDCKRLLMYYKEEAKALGEYYEEEISKN